MSLGRPVLSGIDWCEIAPPFRVAAAIAQAFRIRTLMVATLALLCFLGGDVLLLQFSHDRSPVASMSATLTRPSLASAEAVAEGFVLRSAGLLQLVVDPFRQLSSATGGRWWIELGRCLWRIVCIPIWTMVLARVMVLGITRGESPDVMNALRFVARRIKSLCASMALLVCGIVILAIPLWAANAAIHVAWLTWPVAIVWPLVIATALVWVVFTAAAAVAWPLTCTTLAAEATDSFDAVSRTYAYFFQRPWLLFSCVCCGAVSIFSSGLLIELIVGMTLAVTDQIALASSPLIALWQSFAASVATGYLYAACVSATTAIYLVLRRSIDGVEVNDVWVEPTEFALPGIAAQVARPATHPTLLAKAG